MSWAGGCVLARQAFPAGANWEAVTAEVHVNLAPWLLTGLPLRPAAGANWEAVAAYVDVSQALTKFDPPAEPEAGKGAGDGEPNRDGEWNGLPALQITHGCCMTCGHSHGFHHLLPPEPIPHFSLQP